MQKKIYSFDKYFSADNPYRDDLTIETIERWSKEEDENQGNDTINFYLTK
jgi:hypothetical protein